MKARFLYGTSEEGALRLSIHVESDTAEEAALIRVFRSQGPHQLPDVYLTGLGSGPHEHPEGVRAQNLTFAVREPAKSEPRHCDKHPDEEMQIVTSSFCAACSHERECEHMVVRVGPSSCALDRGHAGDHVTRDGHRWNTEPAKSEPASAVKEEPRVEPRHGKKVPT